MKQVRMLGLFSSGSIVSTRGALEAMSVADIDPLTLLSRHLRGDWGDLDPIDKKLNDNAVKEKTRILSAYTLPNGVKIWIITGWDRSATTFLLPEEY